MKKISAIAWKDFRLRFTNPSEFLFFLVLPVLFTFLVRPIHWLVYRQ